MAFYSCTLSNIVTSAHNAIDVFMTRLVHRWIDLVIAKVKHFFRIAKWFIEKNGKSWE